MEWVVGATLLEIIYHCRISGSGRWSGGEGDAVRERLTVMGGGGDAAGEHVTVANDGGRWNGWWRRRCRRASTVGSHSTPWSRSQGHLITSPFDVLVTKISSSIRSVPDSSIGPVILESEHTLSRQSVSQFIIWSSPVHPWIVCWPLCIVCRPP